ncbi:hypothetical protein RJ639_034402, partial [Escallonia herrerae]
CTRSQTVTSEAIDGEKLEIFEPDFESGSGAVDKEGGSDIDVVNFSAYSYISATCAQVLQKSVLPFAASIAVLLWSGPATAGFMSGSTGIESVPGPELPQIDFLNRFNEANQKKYKQKMMQDSETLPC